MEHKTLTGNPGLVNSDFDQAPDNPLHLLKKWLTIADQLKVSEPRGFVLSTVDIYGKPSSRVVLLKTIDDTGVIFASSETSQKGLDLSKNPIASGTLWWRETMQQINFCGVTTKLPTHLTDTIFTERTREAQAVAALSYQSESMTDEVSLRLAIAKLVHQSKKIERPETWHGYHIAIETIEFWHGSQDRFHNRLRYDLKDGAWGHQKLQP